MYTDAAVREVPIADLRTSLAPLRSRVPKPADGLAPMPIRVVASWDGTEGYEVIDGFKRVKASR